MRKLLVATVVGAAVLSFSVQAQNVAVVNGKAIPKARADFMIEEMVKQGRPKSKDLEDSVKQELINREILIQEATRLGLERDNDVKMRLELARQQILIGALAQSFIAKNKVSDADVKKRYDEYKEQLGATQYRARHVLFEKEDEAKAAIEKLKKGEKFEVLAVASKDTASGQAGGDLGWASPSSFVKPFSDAMVALKPKEFTKVPVKTEFGYHVILLEETRPTDYQSLADLKPELERDIQGAKLQEYQKKLRDVAKIQ
jgi:peptidyl-prolyl cis-trans isomerase C